MEGKSKQVTIGAWLKEEKKLSSTKKKPAQKQQNKHPAVRGPASSNSKKRKMPDSITASSNSLGLYSADNQSLKFSALEKARKELEPPKEEQPKKLSDHIITLSGSQKRVLDTILQRNSVFFTGAAGTGKSYVLRILQEMMENLNLAHRISFTAPTGVAACNIRGLTIHSWAGVGQGTDPIDQIAAQVSRSRQACLRWREAEILVIDEVSMLSAELFDILSFVGSRVRNDPRPFGGLQLILCGDFFQLPPVGLGKNAHFCFEAKAWAQLFPFGGSFQGPQGTENCMVKLDRVFRQAEDSQFLKILNELRKGMVSPFAVQVLNRKVREAQMEETQKKIESSDLYNSTVQFGEGKGAPDGEEKKVEIRPTRLFSLNRDVESVNILELARLTRQANNNNEKNEKNEKIDIKISDYKEWRGIFEEKEGLFKFRAVDESTSEQYMNQLRSGTKAAELLELRKGAQVMLLKNLNTARGLVNGARGTVVDFIPSDGRSSFYPVLPVVQFRVYVGSEKRDEMMVVTHDSWEIKNGERILASRVQIPLMLAWAISIHKSQGMTIPLLEVSFNRIFEFGQGYVALSRATCLDGLTLRSFNPSSIKAHHLVKQFYDRLDNNNNNCSNTSFAGTGLTTADGLISTDMQRLCDNFKKTMEGRDNDEWLDSRNTGNKKKAAVVVVFEDNKDIIVPPEMSKKPNNLNEERSNNIYRSDSINKSNLIRENITTKQEKEVNLSPLKKDFYSTEIKDNNQTKNEKMKTENFMDFANPTPTTPSFSSISGKTGGSGSGLKSDPVLLDGEGLGRGEPLVQPVLKPVSSVTPLSDEMKRRIEKNRKMALARLEENRRQRELESQNFLNNHGV